MFHVLAYISIKGSKAECDDIDDYNKDLEKRQFGSWIFKKKFFETK